MAGNVNSAPTRNLSSAARFKSIFVAQKRTKQDPTDFGTNPAIVNATLKAVPGQTADILQCLDSSDNVLFKINASGVPTGPAAYIVGSQIAPLTITESLLQAASAIGLGVLRVAHVKYDFAVDGGVAGEIIPVGTATIPANAIVIGGIINPIVAPLAAGGAANISIGTHAGSSATSLKAATPKGTYTIDSLLATVPVLTAATAFKMTAAGQVNITVDTNNLTAGVIEIFVVYFVAAGA